MVFFREISRNENRVFKDSDAKWQHDLYFRDEQISKSRYPIPRRDYGPFELVEFLKVNLSILIINLLDESNFI